MGRNHLTRFLDSKLTNRFLRFGRYIVDHPRALTLSVLVILVATGLVFTYRQPNWRQLGPLKEFEEDNVKYGLKISDHRSDNGQLLPSDMTDAPPQYEGNRVMVIPRSGPAFNLPRLQGEVVYHDK